MLLADQKRGQRKGGMKMSEEHKFMLASLKQGIVDGVYAGLISNKEATIMNEELQAKSGQEIAETYTLQSDNIVRTRRIATITQRLDDFVDDGQITSEMADSIKQRILTFDTRDLLDAAVDMNEYQEIHYSIIPSNMVGHENATSNRYSSNR